MSMSPYIFTYSTGAGAIAETLDPDQIILIMEVRLHLSATGGAFAGAFTVTIDSDTGAAYDILLSSTAMPAVQDVHYQPTAPIVINYLDEVDFVFDNPNARTWGLEIVHRQLV